MAAWREDAQVLPPMSRPAVSVLLPVHNGEATLVEALDSLSAQSLEDHEVVVVDDGSTDGTARLLAGRRDARLRVVTTSHVGLVRALNLGLAECRADYVARMDADDISLPDRLRRQWQAMEADADLSVCGTWVEAFPAEDVAEGFRLYVEWQNSLSRHEEICREIFVESPLVHPSVMLRRRQLLDTGGYQDRGWAEDYDLWLRCHLAGLRFGKVTETLLRWREHNERATRTDGRYSVDNFLRAKAHYLARGPLMHRRGLIVWGAGRTGRRLGRYLTEAGRAPDLYVDIAPARIGSTVRDVPIVGPDDVAAAWQRLDEPLLLAAVASRGARDLIRAQLDALNLREGVDYLCAA